MAKQHGRTSPNDFLRKLAHATAEWEAAHEMPPPLPVPAIVNAHRLSPWIVITPPEAEEQKEKAKEKVKPK